MALSASSSSSLPLLLGIEKVQLTGIRNLASQQVTGFRRFNLLLGPNGSGKSSFLEALHLAGMARSFRVNRIIPVIAHGQDQCQSVVQGESRQGRHVIGVQRTRAGEVIAKVNQSRVATLAELAHWMPMQVIDAEVFQLISGGAKVRRQYLDWLVFHVEPQFHHQWSAMQRSLKQRNNLLRRGKIDRSQLLLWGREFAQYAVEVDRLRQATFMQLEPLLNRYIQRFLPELTLSVRLFRGWDDTTPLGQQLAESVERDQELGYTPRGPQRADLRIRTDSGMAVDVLSRGQQKVVASCMRLAALDLALQRGALTSAVLLIDDLPAELDRQMQQTFVESLAALSVQCFITAIEAEAIAPFSAQIDLNEVAVFHVEHGTVSRRDQN